MAGKTGTVSLDNKIRKAQEAVIKTKVKYDAALDELEKPVTQRKQLEDKKVPEACRSGNRTADEIVAFIESGAKK